VNTTVEQGANPDVKVLENAKASRMSLAALVGQSSLRRCLSTLAPGVFMLFSCDNALLNDPGEEQSDVKVELLYYASLLEKYYDREGHYPLSPSDACVPWPARNYWGNYYQYNCESGNRLECSLVSLGADNLAGGAGRDADFSILRKGKQVEFLDSVPWGQR
jgi:hypothetical protein